MAGKLILCRHGQSDWNLKNLFTGWTDVDLTDKGREEALEAGRTIAGLDYDIYIAYTSVLKRALRTLWIMLDEMERVFPRLQRSGRDRRLQGRPRALPRAGAPGQPRAARRRHGTGATGRPQGADGSADCRQG